MSKTNTITTTTAEDFLALAGDWETNQEDIYSINEAVLGEDGADDEVEVEWKDIDIDDIDFDLADEDDREKEMMYYGDR